MFKITLQTLELSSLFWSIITSLIILYVTSCILIGLLAHKSYGLWLRLLLGIELSLITELTRLIARHIIFIRESPESDLSTQTCYRIFFSMYSIG